MAEASIPVNLFNPGQVFACLGFLEAADVLLGCAEGGFDWRKEADTRFALRAKGDKNPFDVVLAFLSEAGLRRWAPRGYADAPSKKKAKKRGNSNGKHEGDESAVLEAPEFSDFFPAPEGDCMALPIRLVGSVNGDPRSIAISHWADASSRNDFKLYSGNRSAAQIAMAMLGTPEKPKKGAKVREAKTQGVHGLWRDSKKGLTDPLNVLTSMGGSFNFDPRGAWIAIDAGYSPNDQEHGVAASPLVEILAAMGLEHARPQEYGTRQVRYGVWGDLVPPLLARAALCAGRVGIPIRIFRFTLNLSGKNKVVTFAEEEINK